jgi:hypothetical protein
MDNSQNLYPLSDYIQSSAKKCWQLEEKDFSPWLAKHLEPLNDLLGVQLVLDETEAKTGRYKTDILATDDRTGDTVIIENQFGTSNHDHLGKCLTYQAYHDAKIVIWIGDSFSEEHLNAIEFLNNITPEEYRYYAVSVLLYQIDSKWYYQFVEGVERNAKCYNRKTTKKCKAELKYIQLWEELCKLLTSQTLKEKFQPWGRSYHDAHIEKTPFYLGVSFAREKKSVYLWVYDKDKKWVQTIDTLLESSKFKELGVYLNYQHGSRNSDWDYWTTGSCENQDVRWVAKTFEMLYKFFNENLYRHIKNNELKSSATNV